MTWITRTRETMPSLAKHHASILNTMLSLIFGTVQVSATAQRLNTHAISIHQINNPRYESIWYINQLYQYQRERPESNLLSNEELQIVNIDPLVSIIDDEEHTAANIVQKISYTFSGLEIWSMLIRDSLTYVLIDQFRHLEFKMQQKTPQRTYLLQNQLHSVFDGRTVNVFTHHAYVIRKKQEFYVFAVNQEQDSIASALLSPLETLASPISYPVIYSKPVVDAESHNDRESVEEQKQLLQKMIKIWNNKIALDSSTTKDSDRQTTSEAQKWRMRSHK
ncbi:MAG: hypothetical protein EZS28_019770 [Streblomastix strix]|uniref:Uncharacterized protein n=1 Tax=Streblomastix strix TaxID=222440 RepID=A0A5J4VQ58_9EUKA|nr:MAG: hypothetical protein EZS28_019770 [Streblomastix strix]